MKGKRLYLLIALTVVALAAALTAGCKIGERTLQDNLDQIGATSRVTYFSNGGTFNGSATVKNVYYAPDNKIYEIKTKDERGDYDPDIYVDYDGFLLDGWYRVKTDGEGEVVYINEELKTVELTDEKIEFPYTIGDEEYLYVGAKWTPDVRLEYVLAGDITITDGDGNAYTSGSVIKSEKFGTDGTISVSSAQSPLVCSDATFLQIYSDEECTTVFSGTVRKPTEEGAENPKVYVKYVEGLWTVVRTASNVSEMFSRLTLSSYKYYLFPDSGNEIDCSSVSLSVNEGNFACTIEGNGVTLKNLTFSRSSIQNGAVYSVFGEFTSNAKISNLTLSGVNVNYSLQSSNVVADLYMLCKGADDNTVMENVTIEDFEMNVNLSGGMAVNLQGNVNWLCGDSGTVSGDSAFLEKFTGLTLTNGKLVIDGEESRTINSENNQEDSNI